MAYVNLQTAAVKVTYQLPTEYTRVGYLLKPLEKTSDPRLQVAIACVKNDAEMEEGKHYMFEATATFLLPNCPVTRRRDTKKRVSGEKSEANVEEMPQAEVAAFGNKPSIRKTGVHLQYHSYKEFQQLTDEQKDELNTYHKKHGNFKKSSNGKSQAGNRPNKKEAEVKKKVKFVHAVNGAVAKRMDEESKKDTAEIDSYIAGMICKQIGNGVPTNASANASSTNANVNPGGTLLKAITKHVKNINPN